MNLSEGLKCGILKREQFGNGQWREWNEEETGLELEKKESRQKWVRGRHVETERERGKSI